MSGASSAASPPNASHPKKESLDYIKNLRVNGSKSVASPLNGSHAENSSLNDTSIDNIWKMWVLHLASCVPRASLSGALTLPAAGTTQ